MAQANLSVALDNLSGKAGSLVFVNTKNGTVIRPRRTPRNPRTAAQTAARTALGKSASTYKNMTTTQVTAWQNYALSQPHTDPKTGKTSTPSGISAFTKLTAKFLQVAPNAAIPMIPPASAFTGDSVTVTASAVSGTLTFRAAGVNVANVTTELLLQPLVSHNRAPQTGGYRSKGFVVFTSSVNDQDFNLNPGSYVPAYRFVNTLTGQDSGLVALPIVTVG